MCRINQNEEDNKIFVLQEENTENAPDEESMPDEFLDDDNTTEKAEEGNLIWK